MLHTRNNCLEVLLFGIKIDIQLLISSYSVPHYRLNNYDSPIVCFDLESLLLTSVYFSGGVKSTSSASS
jgi:hypothetical protein